MCRRWRRDLAFESQYPQITPITQIFFAVEDAAMSGIRKNNLCNLRNLWMISWARLARPLVSLCLSLIFLFQPVPALACGPETVEPIFVFSTSPDLPFDEFTRGKIGIVQPTFGRKTLVIAHRFLNGGTFTEDEQRGLVLALKGKPPEDDDNSATKAWIAARKEVVGEEKEPLAIYDERRHDGYDFFPNCTSNAFEVATQTLKERVASYGAEDNNVRDWLRAQDVVFKNCAEGAEAPPAASSGPQWLQKDRDYQIAAANFYSLNFREARTRFETIANDGESIWQDTAAYLVGRTLVREASLSGNDREKRALYERAETYLINLMAGGGRFRSAAKRLLGLVRFRLRPEERVRELAQVLDQQSGNENVRQDLIDYTWLLDKFDAQVQKDEEERKNKLNPTPSPTPYPENLEYKARYEAIQRGELIDLYFTPKKSDGEAEYPKGVSLDFKPDVTEAEVFQQVEIELGRKLLPEESQDLKERFAGAVSRRQWLLSPNRKINSGRDYDGCDWSCNDLKLDMLPEFIRADDLSDWIMTFQSNDPRAFAHAATMWRQSHSTAWLVAALTKSTKASRGLVRLMRDAERVEDYSPAFPTIAYQLVRLRFELNKHAEAQKLLDKIIATQFDSLPISSQNLFLEARLEVAGNVDEFLRFALRKPVAFTEYGTIGHISDLLKIQKGLWNAEYYKETKEEYERATDESFKELLLWDDRKTFDVESADQFNWNFSLRALLQTSRNETLPEYLRKTLALTVWTRAVLLKNESVALDVSQDVNRLAPEMAALLSNYMNATTRAQRENEALYILLKFPSLSPYVPSGISEVSTSEESEYYFETSWWCETDDIEYHLDGTESPKVVPAPRFLGAQSLAVAKKERNALLALGNAKSFLGKRVLEWAKRSPGDSRIPEALYIAVQANQSYKYGCGAWEQDEETRVGLEQLLRQKYPRSSWAVKLAEADQ